MKIVVTYLSILVLSIVLCSSMSAQSISGPKTVCPFQPVTYTFVPPATGACSITWEQVLGPDQVVASNQSGNTIQYTFPAHRSGAVYHLAVGYACPGSGGVATFDVTVNTVGLLTSENRDIACSLTGTQTFTFDMTGISGTPVWSNDAGWPVAVPSQTVGTTNSITYNVNNHNSATITVQVENSLCPGSAVNQKTFNISRSASTSLPAPVINNAAIEFQLCNNAQLAVSATPYTDAVNYIWNATAPGITINGQVPPVTVSAANGGNSITLGSGSASGTGSVTCTVQTSCGTTPATSASLTVGTPNFVLSGPTNTGVGRNVTYTVLPDLPGVSYEWEPGGARIITGGDHKIVVQWPESAGGLSTTMGCLLTGTPTCGRTILVSLDVQLAGGAFLVSPNPATNTVNISQETIAASGNAKLNQTRVSPSSIDEVQVLDKFNNIKKTRKFAAGTYNTSIDVSDLPADVYILHIRSGKEWTSKKIIVSTH